MKKNFLLLVCVFLLGGCAELRQTISKPGTLPETNFTHYLLSCVNDIQDFGVEEFKTNFKIAEDGLQSGSDQDTLRFICLSLYANADYKQFKKGSKVLEQYITEHSDSADDIRGLKVLIDRLDEEILNRWSSWKSLVEEKNQLTAEKESLQKKIDEDQIVIKELQKQIEQLKNIENIIKNREAEQP